MKKSTVLRVMEEWRGHSAPREGDRCVDLADSLRKVLPRLGLGERLCEAEIQAAWVEIVGEFLAEHSKPVKLSQGVLTVQVMQPTVMYELDRAWRRRVIEKLRGRFSNRAIRDVRFHI